MTGWSQYVDKFGGIADLGKKAHLMGHAVQSFFENGGGKAYVVRLATGALPATAKLITAPSNASVAGDIQTYLDIKAATPGDWANDLAVELTRSNGTATPPLYSLAIGRRLPKNQNKLAAQEVFTDLSLDSANAASSAPSSTRVPNSSALTPSPSQV